jgi:hypothetical protein
MSPVGTWSHKHFQLDPEETQARPKGFQCQVGWFGVRRTRIF